MKIAMAGDHAGYELKALLRTRLEDAGHEVHDFGPFGPESVDYPDFVHPLAKSVVAKEAELGILICGSGNGVCMTANKYADIRAALCWEPELGALARQHNNANVLCIPARFVSVEKAFAIADSFLSAQFEGGRHQNRVDKIAIK